MTIAQRMIRSDDFSNLGIAVKAETESRGLNRTHTYTFEDGSILIIKRNVRRMSFKASFGGMAR